MSTETTAPAGWVWFPSLRAHFIRDGRPVCRPLKSWRGRVEKSVAHLGDVGWYYRCRHCVKALGVPATELCAGCSIQRRAAAGWLVGYVHERRFLYRITSAGEATEAADQCEVFCPSCAATFRRLDLAELAART